MLTPTLHRPEEVTTLSTSSSWPPIYILITFLGKPSRPHSAWQAAGKTHRALWQRWRGQACWPAEQQPLGWGTSLQGLAWIPQPRQLQAAPTYPRAPTPSPLAPLPFPAKRPMPSSPCPKSQAGLLYFSKATSPGTTIQAPGAGRGSGGCGIQCDLGATSHELFTESAGPQL